MTTGAPDSWKQRATESDSALERKYAPGGLVGEESGVKTEPRMPIKAAKLET